jgi:hypothetical protein
LHLRPHFGSGSYTHGPTSRQLRGALASPGSLLVGRAKPRPTSLMLPSLVTRLGTHPTPEITQCILCLVLYESLLRISRTTSSGPTRCTLCAHSNGQKPRFVEQMQICKLIASRRTSNWVPGFRRKVPAWQSNQGSSSRVVPHSSHIDYPIQAPKAHICSELRSVRRQSPYAPHPGPPHTCHVRCSARDPGTLLSEHHH